jgi:hypothetical protein
LGDALGEVGTDLLDVGVNGMDRVEPILDEHLDIPDTSGKWFPWTPLRLFGRQIVGLRCEFSVQSLANVAHRYFRFAFRLDLNSD